MAERSSNTQSVDSKPTADDVPCDFTAYLCQRLGMGASDAQRLLGEWLANYKPQRPRPICFTRVDESRELPDCGGDSSLSQVA